MKKSYDSKFKSCMALEALRGEISGPSESGSVLGKETHGRSVRDFPVQEERNESKLYTENDLIKKIGHLEIGNDFLRRCP